MGRNSRKSYTYSQVLPLSQGEHTLTWWSVRNMSLTAFLVLISTITAVIRTVTHPVRGNAAVVPTFKLGGCAKFVCKGWQRELSILEKMGGIYHNRKSCFPSAVGRLRKNSLGFQSCFVFSRKNKGTLGLTTVCLISSVLTVVLLITGPAHRNAAPAGAGKEVYWTFKLPFICRVTEKKHIM